MKLNKSILRVMKENRGQYIGMLYMLILSVFLFVALTITAQNLKYNKDMYVKNNVQEDLEFYTSNKIDNIREIEDKFDLKFQETLVKEYKYGDKTLRLFTPNKKVNITAVLEGAMPRVGEIALDPQFAKSNKLNIGDEYHIGNSSYRISGYIGIPNYAYILEKDGDVINNPKNFGIGILNKEDMVSGDYLYSVKYNKNREIYTQSKNLKNYLNTNEVNIIDWTYAKNNMKISMLDIEVTAISVYSVILPTVILLITVVLISIVLGRMMKNEMANIGTLYALGYRKKEIMIHYMNYPIILSSISGVIGGIIGIIVQKYLFDLFLTFFPIPIEKISYSPIYFILGIVLCMVFSIIGSYLSINKVLKLSPVLLMKNENKRQKVNIIERKLTLNNLKFKNKFAIREQLRSISRLAFLVIGVSIATVFLMYGFIAKCSMDYMINQERNDVISYKYEYILKQLSTDKPPIGGEGVSGVKFVLDSEMNNDFELIGGNKNSQMISLKDKKGNEISIDDNKFIITSIMAKKYNLSIGDKLSFINIVDDKEYSIKITDIAQTNSGDYVFTSLNSFNQMMGLEKGSYNAIMSKTPIEINKDMVYMTNTPNNITNMLEDYMQLMSAFIYGIAFVAFIIGVIIIYVVASISIDENKNHIALMKVFGYKKKEINSMMLNGSRIYVVLGYIIGVPIGYSIIKVIFKIFESLDIALEARLNLSYVIIGFVIIILTFEVSKFMCARKIDKISLSEALKTQKE
ncbi:MULTISPECIES: ABC transporter permease [Clostridioides]|uniref:ABC transporter permease n=1 Tax=Clostridioides sp. ZZV14-6387 TaxID=2811497 RepID=UPI0007BBAF40|nr:FtsX-like permease family protein [Clostridioides sp. ZZV14-6387]CZR97996.1 FtsX-like permease family protein [Clostridioides difficile]CZS02513.1 FtsX-like permease family protein [Clostridioides difficile]